MKNALVLLVLVISYGAHAQKVKYKDVYELIATDQYEKALPDLDLFLQQNPGHPSGTLHRGVLALEVEQDCDGAKKYFDNALGVIDQKELDKNDKYYALWNKRDLRSGKYAVKLDNVRLDIEDRLKACQ